MLFAIGQDMTEELALKEKTVQHEKLAAVGTLAAGLAHEIRNPLNGAQLHVSFLQRAIKKRGNEPEMLEAVNVVGDEIQRLAALVTRVPRLRTTAAAAAEADPSPRARASARSISCRRKATEAHAEPRRSTSRPRPGPQR